MLILFGGLANSHRLMACRDHGQILSPTLNSIRFSHLQIYKIISHAGKNHTNAENRTANANEIECANGRARRVRSAGDAWWNENPIASANWSGILWRFDFHRISIEIPKSSHEPRTRRIIRTYNECDTRRIGRQQARCAHNHRWLCAGNGVR